VFPAASDLRASLTPSLHILAMGGRKETGVGGGDVFCREVPVELQGSGKCRGVELDGLAS
jgi:hypothetical protein